MSTMIKRAKVQTWYSINFADKASKRLSLIGGLEHDFYNFPFHIWDVILPIDELHHFSEG